MGAPGGFGAAGCFFLLIGLGVVTYGIVKVQEINAIEYRATTCELIRASGPHHTECSDDSDTSTSTDTGYRRLRHRRLVDFDLKFCGTYHCVYTMRSELTGNKVFEADGDADEHRCTEFPDSSDGLRPKTDCYAQFKSGKATGLALQTKEENRQMAIALIIFGSVFSCIASCFVCCSLDCERPSRVDQLPHGTETEIQAPVSRKADVLSDLQTCIVCMNDDAIACLKPCGHANFCRACTEQLATPQTCPLCRVPIEQIVYLDSSGTTAVGTHSASQAGKREEKAALDGYWEKSTPPFGTWLIQGQNLTLPDGSCESLSEVTSASLRRGRFTAELREDGKLLWSNGSVWVRPVNVEDV